MTTDRDFEAHSPDRIIEGWPPTPTGSVADDEDWSQAPNQALRNARGDAIPDTEEDADADTLPDLEAYRRPSASSRPFHPSEANQEMRRAGIGEFSAPGREDDENARIDNLLDEELTEARRRRNSPEEEIEVLQDSKMRHISVVPNSGEARQAAENMLALAARIGHAPEEGNLPPNIRDILSQHRWSSFFSLCLWGAAGDATQHPVVRWLGDVVQELHIP